MRLFSLASRYGSKLAAIAVFSGEYKTFLSEADDSEARQLRHLGIRAYHSRSDDYVPVRHTEQLLEWLCRRYGEKNALYFNRRPMQQISSS